MSYSGATAASSVANPPIRIAGSVGGALAHTSTGGTGGGLWLYSSSNGTTELQGANFFTDAYYLGMKKGDMIMGVCCTGSSACVYVGAVGAVTTDGAAISSTGGSMTSTFA